MVILKWKKLFLKIYKFLLPFRQKIATSKQLIKFLFNVKVPSNVSVDFDMTSILLRYATGQEIRRKCKIFEMGVGTGSIISIYNAKRFQNKAFGADISDRRVKQSRYVAEMNDIQFDYITSDLFTNINDKFDYVIFNPPFVPTQILKELDFQNVYYSKFVKGNRSNVYVPSEAGIGEDGGQDGMKIIDRFLKEVPFYLNKTGKVMLGVQEIYITRKMICNCLKDIPLKIHLTYKLPFLTSAVYVLVKDN